VTGLFTKIINNEIPAFKVAEDEHYLAFLDINPVQEGHTLVIPKIEVDYIFDLEDDVISGLMVFAKKVAAKMKKVIPCNRIGVSVIGLEVPHAHVHLIPISNLHDINFEAERTKFSQDQLKEIADKIRMA